MKAALLLTVWVVAGLVVAGRARRPLAEQALAVLFWPFYLGRSAQNGPLERLAAALGPSDAASALVGGLARAFFGIEARLARVEEALARTGPDSERSRRLLLDAREKLKGELAEARDAVDEAATRLALMAADGERGEVESLLRALQARLMAGEEVGERGTA